MGDRVSYKDGRQYIDGSPSGIIVGFIYHNGWKVPQAVIRTMNGNYISVSIDLIKHIN